ncbi:hypothetical protein ACLOJK_001570 [Asimina triloba]
MPTNEGEALTVHVIKLRVSTRVTQPNSSSYPSPSPQSQTSGFFRSRKCLRKEHRSPMKKLCWRSRGREIRTQNEATSNAAYLERKPRKRGTENIKEREEREEKEEQATKTAHKRTEQNQTTAGRCASATVDDDLGRQRTCVVGDSSAASTLVFEDTLGVCFGWFGCVCKKKALRWGCGFDLCCRRFCRGGFCSIDVDDPVILGILTKGLEEYL